jgi:uncharacterized protein (DUF58 family)
VNLEPPVREADQWRGSEGTWEVPLAGVTRAASPKLAGYAGLVGAALLGALALRRPELVAVAGAFALPLALALAFERAPSLRLTAELERDRTLQGDELTLTLDVEGDQVERLELLIDVPAGLAVVDGSPRVVLRLGHDQDRSVDLRLRAQRWGAYLLGGLRVRAHDRFGVLLHEQRLEPALPLKVYPHAETLRALLRPQETQVFSGNQVARTRGEGIEFADLRPFAPGDRLRRINWRASARRGTIWVNEAHPERNADVVIFLDTFAEARGGGRGTLDLAVGAAGSLAERYLRNKDRVGLVGFGGVLNWLLPATGVVQLYRIVDSLLDTEIVLNYAWKDLDIIPARTLPPKALVVALTPLIDKRSVSALLDLRRRGFDLAIVEIDPAPYVEPGKDELERLAFRLWQLRREALRSEYERVGVPVVPWRSGESLQVALEEVRSFRRGARAVRA